MNTYKKIPVTYKKNKDGELIKTLYPVYWNIQKEKHLKNYKNVLNKIFVKSLQLKYKSNIHKNAIINHIYDTYYNEYKFNIEDVKIDKDYDEPNYFIEIDNEDWSVQYSILIVPYGYKLDEIVDEYVKENISYFNRETIWIHLKDYKFPIEDREKSDFEDTNTKCPICLDDYCEEKECDELHNCGHKYCVDCIEQVIEYGSCSICRETTDTEDKSFELTFNDIKFLADNFENEKLIQLLKDEEEYDKIKKLDLDK